MGRAAGEPAQRPRQAVHRLLLRLPPQPQPRLRALALRGVPVPGRRAPHEGPVHRRLRRPRDLPAGPARRVLRQRVRPDAGGVRARLGEPGQAHVQPLVRPPGRGTWSGPAAPGRRGDAPQGRQALHRGLARGLPRLQAQRPLDLPVPRGLPRGRHQEHPRPQGADDPPARPRRVRRGRRGPRRDRLHRPELRRGALRAAAPGGLLLDRHPGAQRLRRSRGRAAVHPHPPAVLRADHRRTPLLARREPHLLLQRLRAVDAEVARRDVRGLPDPRGHERVRPADDGPEEEDPRAERRGDLRHPVPEELQVANPPQHAEPQAVAVA